MIYVGLNLHKRYIISCAIDVLGLLVAGPHLLKALDDYNCCRFTTRWILERLDVPCTTGR